VTRVRRILHGSDFSRASGRAFRAAIALARATQARVTVVHVLAPVVPVIPEHYLGSPQIELLRGRVRRWSEQRLAALVQQAVRRGIRADGRLLEGDPVEQILREARRGRSDLIVVGTHGRSGLTRLLIGSVAGRLVASSSRPVLTVRGR